MNSFCWWTQLCNRLHVPPKAQRLYDSCPARHAKATAATAKWHHFAHGDAKVIWRRTQRLPALWMGDSKMCWKKPGSILAADSRENAVWRRGCHEAKLLACRFEDHFCRTFSWLFPTSYPSFSFLRRWLGWTPSKFWCVFKYFRIIVVDPNVIICVSQLLKFKVDTVDAVNERNPVILWTTTPANLCRTVSISRGMEKWVTIAPLTVTKAAKFVKAPFFCDRQDQGGQTLTPIRQWLLLLLRSMCTQKCECSTKLAPTLSILHGFHQLVSCDAEPTNSLEVFTATWMWINSRHAKIGWL